MIATAMGAATDDQLNELRTLFQTKRHSPFWRASNFARIRELQADGEPITAAYVESMARFLRQQPDLPPYQPAEGKQYDDLRYVMDRREVPEPIASWLAERIANGKLSKAFAEMALDDLTRLPKKPRRPGHQLPKGIPGSEVPDGGYAIGDPARCYFLRTDAAGQQIVKLLHLGTGRRTLVGDPVATHVVLAISRDVNAAQRLFGETAHRCTACGRPIGDGDNNPGYVHGYGPDCWRELQRELRKNQTLISTDLEAHSVR